MADFTVGGDDFTEANGVLLIEAGYGLVNALYAENISTLWGDFTVHQVEQIGYRYNCDVIIIAYRKGTPDFTVHEYKGDRMIDFIVPP